MPITLVLVTPCHVTHKEGTHLGSTQELGAGDGGGLVLPLLLIYEHRRKAGVLQTPFMGNRAPGTASCFLSTVKSIQRSKSELGGQGKRLRSHGSSLAELEFAVRQAGPPADRFFWEMWRISAVPELLGHSSILYPGVALERRPAPTVKSLGLAGIAHVNTEVPVLLAALQDVAWAASQANHSKATENVGKW